MPLAKHPIVFRNDDILGELGKRGSQSYYKYKDIIVCDEYQRERERERERNVQRLKKMYNECIESKKKRQEDFFKVEP